VRSAVPCAAVCRRLYDEQRFRCCANTKRSKRAWELRKTIAFDIPSQPLASALEAFSRVAEIELFYESGLVIGPLLARSGHTPKRRRQLSADSVAKVPKGVAANFPLKDEASDNRRSMQRQTRYRNRL
jgi:hypothetical protein